MGRESQVGGDELDGRLNIVTLKEQRAVYGELAEMVSWIPPPLLGNWVHCHLSLEIS
jgi:hypothetical protein